MLASASTLAAALIAVPLVAGRAIKDTSLVPYTFPSLTGCPPEPVFSCENTTAIANTCCTPSPGGLVLVTGFWNTYTGRERQGQLLPARNWGMHGLWPDFCDGSYTQYCDLSRQFDPFPSPNTTTGLPNGTVVPPWKGESAIDVLKRFGRHDLLSYMQGYWPSRNEPSELLWAHEYAKHATCMSTFDKECYPDWQVGLDMVDYFAAAVRAHKMYPTWDILASSGIVPSNTTRYSLNDLNKAFKSQLGAVPYFGCSKDDSGERTILSEVWVYAHVLGTPQYGSYKVIETTFPSTCSNVSESLWYYERTPGSEVSKYN